MIRHKSVETIGGLEVIDLQPTEVSKFMSKATIKVLYLGENRNGSVIDKETAEKLAKTLRGAPVVGRYDTKKKDFGTHEEFEMSWWDDTLTANYETKPYGFVPTDAKVWFKDYEDDNKDVRTYLLTDCYLWTHQYPEITKAVNEGVGQSMELDKGSINAHWEDNPDEEGWLQLYIINDAAITKLCVLGDDVEPCFEGASVTKEGEGVSYSLSDFSKTVGYMFSLIDTGHKDDNSNKSTNSYPVIPTYQDDKAATNTTPTEALVNAGVKLSQTMNELKELQAKYDALTASIPALNEELETLREFKAAVEHERRENLISKYRSLLTNEEIQPIAEDMDSYTLEDLEAKLSVIYVNNHVSLEKGKPSVTPAVTTFSIATTEQHVSDNIDSGLLKILNAAEQDY